MDESNPSDVVLLRTGQLEFRIQGLEIRVEPDEALKLLVSGLQRLGWYLERQSGLQIDDRDPVAMSEVKLKDTVERLRASGTFGTCEYKSRHVLAGPWVDPTVYAPAAIRPPERKFVKDAVPKPSVVPPKKTPARVIQKTTQDGSIDIALFDDPIEQLEYEVRHAYLFTVPRSQRSQWPMAEYLCLPSFLEDIDSQVGQLSRQQMISAIVDVVSGRVSDVNSRRPRPLREGGGSDGRTIVVRSDGAVAWRANVSAGTPAARRIMWWRTPVGKIELARVATHDDLDMPER